MTDLLAALPDGLWMQLALTTAIGLGAGLLDRIGTPRIVESGDRSRFKSPSAARGVHVARAALALVAFLALLAIWNVDLHAVLIFSTTALTLLGAALFATWSILSNVTSYFALLFNPQFQRGNVVRVIDADNYLEGTVSELGLLRTKLITERREVVFYPNNLLLTRPTVINPRQRLAGFGKIGLPAEPVPGGPGRDAPEPTASPSGTVRY